MKTYYHGTVQAFVPEIKQNGLRITAKHAWKISFDHFGELVSPDEGEPETPGVYVTAHKDHAIAYAQTRADYFQRKPGACFSFYETPADLKGGDYLFLSKDKDAPVIETHPVLLTLNLDETIHLEMDLNDQTYGLVTRQNIPLSAIVKFETLPDKYDTRAFTKATRKRLSDEAYTAMFGKDAELAKRLAGEMF